MGRLDNKVVIVTGAGAGIGRAAVARYLEEGACVLGADLRPDALCELERDYKSPSLATIIVNVARAAHVQQMVESAVVTFGRLDGIHNNAGVVPQGTVEETSEEDWDRQMAVNVRSVFLASKAVIPIFKQQGGGAIVNTASVAGMVGIPARAAYCASKAAVIGLSRAMAKDYAGLGIRVNCVCPGTVDTPSWRERVNSSENPKEAMKAFIARQPMGRVGAPEEVAAAALYLLSDEAAFITGTCLVIDGGWCA